MFRGQRVAVVVPAFNEAAKITRTIRSIPGFVDHVLVVDDASVDHTARLAARTRRRGLEVIRHELNQGVGAAIASGYQRALALGADITAVMAGDSQMDPADLGGLMAAVAGGQTDYAKGNRFMWPGAWRVMPLSRLIGNLVLSHLTRLASGYGQVFDSQCGYTVANRRALGAFVGAPGSPGGGRGAGQMFARYGYPNDLLVRLGRAGLRVQDVAVRPVYGPDWRSGIRIMKVVWPLGQLLAGAIAVRLARGLFRPVGRLVVRRLAD